jgi:hypothetical protein
MTFKKLYEPFAVDTDFLLKYFEIPTEVSSHSLGGGSLAYVHFRIHPNAYTYSMKIGDWTSYASNSIELQLLLLIAYLKRNNAS